MKIVWKNGYSCIYDLKQGANIFLMVGQTSSLLTLVPANNLLSFTSFCCRHSFQLENIFLLSNKVRRIKTMNYYVDDPGAFESLILFRFFFFIQDIFIQTND